jgi:bifunctional enzyme CysN/CysC
LYRRALAGEIKNFTGVEQLYEVPENPELHLLAAKETPETLADQAFKELVKERNFLGFAP